ncbi:MAG: hypothetical protein HC913_02895 [Microscillaceae bacterium]|nr:hypothetical protein [Microscillaceae bacterium]
MQIDPFISFHFDFKNAVLESTWKTRYEMSEEEYKKVVLRYVEEVERTHPRFVLLDTRQAYFTINPDLQAWVSNTVRMAYEKVGLRKRAFLMSKDFIVQLSVEQIVEEGEGKIRANQRFFSEHQEALNWLLGR